MLVPTKRTPVSMLAFSSALIATHHDLTKPQAALLHAQYAGETGDGYHCYGNNLGNVKWTQGCGLDHHALIGTWECFAATKADELVASGMGMPDDNAGHACGAGRKSVIFSPRNPITWFRAYPDLATAMRSFIAMKQAGRFSTAWPFVLAADCAGFAKDLGTPKVRPGDKHPTVYFTAGVDAYAKLMLAKHAAFMGSDAWERAWERALQLVAPGSHGSHAPTQPIELAREGVPLVDPISGDTWVRDFDVVHPDVDLPDPTRCEECFFVSCRC